MQGSSGYRPAKSEQTITLHIAGLRTELVLSPKVIKGLVKYSITAAEMAPQRFGAEKNTGKNIFFGGAKG